MIQQPVGMKQRMQIDLKALLNFSVLLHLVWSTYYPNQGFYLNNKSVKVCKCKVTYATHTATKIKFLKTSF